MMAESSDKDLHEPVKEGTSSSYLVSCSCIDPRERHSVYKLDRCELEDRYLRLLDEVTSLKKLSNGQEDKIKRLATKLMRFGVNPRGACVAALDLCEDRDKLALLETENAKLRNKVCLLRNQLMNNKIFGGSSAVQRQVQRASLPLGSTSGPTTCRSESSRLKATSCQCVSACTGPTANENDLQNYSFRIQELEAEKKEMTSRIAELELELASLTSGNRREKVAENVEYIRVWRQMKRQNEKLVSTQAVNDMLNKRICQLKRHLEESSKSNEEVNAALEAERKQLADLDNNMSKVKDSQINLREKDDRIMDLMNEIKILQQHNRELLELSAKFAKVEQENVDLKRKIGEQLSDYETLKDNFNHEKTNMVALQAANDQLLVKLYDLQKNIDLMTIQLMEQNEKYNKASSKKTSKRANDYSSSFEEESNSIDKLSARKSKSRKECCNNCNNLQTINVEQYEKGVQTSETLHLTNEATQTENLYLSNGAKFNENINPSDVKNKNNIQLSCNNGKNTLSREGMLKLLEQVQISTPLESQNASIMRRVDTVPINFLTISRQKSKLETFLFGDSLF